MSLHRVLWPDLREAGGSVTITGDEALHAVRVKRLDSGDQLALHDGRGRIAIAEVSGVRKAARSGAWELDVVVREISVLAPASARVEVWSAAPKGPRLEEMIEGLSEVGAASWAPLRVARSVVEPREGKIERLRRIASESLKQCGRAWALEIAEGGELSDAFADLDKSASLIVADASGEPYRRAPEGAGTIRILIGPEGGFTTEELSLLRSAGARSCTFGPHVLRIETAAVVAAAIVVDHERRV